jgi:hypothetical protein
MSKLDQLVLNSFKAHIEKLNAFDRDEVLEILNSDDLTKKSAIIKRYINKITIYDDQIVMDLHNQIKSMIINYYFAGYGRHSTLRETNSSIMASQNQKWAILRSYLQGMIWQQKLLEHPCKTIEAIAAEYRRSTPHEITTEII